MLHSELIQYRISGTGTNNRFLWGLEPVVFQKTKAVDENLTDWAMDVGDCISVVAKQERVLNSSYYNVSIMIAFNDEPKANTLISLER